MAVFSHISHPLAFSFGILGNIISFMVYLAPVPTFYRIWKKKSTEGFQSVPYVVALFSATLWIYYAFLKTDGTLLLTINGVGVLIECSYIIMFLYYGTKEARVTTVKLLLLLNVGVFGAIFFITFLFVKDTHNRLKVLGWICGGLSVSVFVAPLSIMRLVIQTKSVEFMPFPLSFFLTLSAVMWFAYGLLTKDFFVALPNVLGFIFGIIQMVLYVVYMNKKPAPIIPDDKLSAKIMDIIKPTTIGCELHTLEIQNGSDRKTIALDQTKRDSKEDQAHVNAEKVDNMV